MGVDKGVLSKSSDRYFLLWSTCDMAPYMKFLRWRSFSQSTGMVPYENLMRGFVQRVGVNSVSLRKSTVLLPVRFLRGAVSKGRGAPYLCEGFLCKLASIFYVFDVEGCDFDPLPVVFLGLYLQNQLELGKTFKQRPFEFSVFVDRF